MLQLSFSLMILHQKKACVYQKVHCWNPNFADHTGIFFWISNWKLVNITNGMRTTPWIFNRRSTGYEEQHRCFHMRIFILTFSMHFVCINYFQKAQHVGDYQKKYNIIFICWILLLPTTHTHRTDSIVIYLWIFIENFEKLSSNFFIHAYSSRICASIVYSIR